MGSLTLILELKHGTFMSKIFLYLIILGLFFLEMQTTEVYDIRSCMYDSVDSQFWCSMSVGRIRES